MTVDEVGLAALNDHKASNVKLTLVDQAGVLQVLLSNDISELLDQVDQVCLLLCDLSFLFALSFNSRSFFTFNTIN